uniref:Trichome birefringence-like C-terminal domain-containing protein n=1 Tax=Oryza brachyantha TaxID=4533 RepID=J3MX81_ORYBR
MASLMLGGHGGMDLRPTNQEEGSLAGPDQIGSSTFAGFLQQEQQVLGDRTARQNKGHHWNRGKFNGNHWELYADGKPIGKGRLADLNRAKNLALYSIARWVDSELVQYPQMKVFLRTILPRHFVIGYWNTEGSCGNTIHLSNGSELRDEGHISNSTFKLQQELTNACTGAFLFGSDSLAFFSSQIWNLLLLQSLIETPRVYTYSRRNINMGSVHCAKSVDYLFVSFLLLE